MCSPVASNVNRRRLLLAFLTKHSLSAHVHAERKADR
jgi:hypothetical protein